MSRYGEEEAGTGAVSKPWAMVAVKDGPLLLPLFMYSCPLCGLISYLKVGGHEFLCIFVPLYQAAQCHIIEQNSFIYTVKFQM
jgi:hypothetical protein